MPPKRKNLGRKTSNAQKKKNTKKQHEQTETEEARKARSLAERIRVAQYRERDKMLARSSSSTRQTHRGMQVRVALKQMKNLPRDWESKTNGRQMQDKLRPHGKQN